MDQAQIEAMKRAAAEAATVAAAKAFADMKAEEAAKAKVAADAEAAKQAEEAKFKALEDKIRAEIFGDAVGQRSAPLQNDEAGRVKVGEKMTKGTGIELARVVKAIYVAKQDGRAPAEVAKSWGYHDAAKALSSGSFSGMGSLIQTEIANDFIELLRTDVVMRKAGARQIPLPERLEFDGQATAASASWGGDSEEITVSNMTTNKPLVLTPKNLRALSVIPNALLRALGPKAEEYVVNDLRQVVAIEEDQQFLYGPGTSSKPLGAGHSTALHTDHVYAMTALSSAGVPTVGEVKKELRKALKKLKLAKLPQPGNVVFIMSPSIEQAILQAVGPGGEGANQIELEYAMKGTMCGRPAFVTNQITESSTADFFAIDMSHFYIGDAMGLEVEVFPNGAWSESGTAKSGISLDKTPVRLIKRVDSGLRYNKAGVKVTGMTWGI